MRQFVICFDDRETISDRIDQIGAAVPGGNLENFLAKNEVLSARTDDEPKYKPF